MKSAEQAITKMGEVGERSLQDGIGVMVEEEVYCPDLFAHWKLVCP